MNLDDYATRHLTELPWWQKYSFGIEARFTGVEERMTLKDWVFSYEATVQRTKGALKVFWPRAWIRICGLQVGAGLYVVLGTLPRL